jgi:hypothetical protein
MMSNSSDFQEMEHRLAIFITCPPIRQGKWLDQNHFIQAIVAICRAVTGRSSGQPFK